MSKKTLIILAALLGIFFAFLSFESRLSECKPAIKDGLAIRRCPGVPVFHYTTTTDLVIVFLARVGVIVMVSGGLLFLLRKQAGEK